MSAIGRVSGRHGLAIGVFGHAGDGDFNPTYVTPPDTPDVHGLVDAAGADLYGEELAPGGTITGEHGAGQSKRGFLERQVRPRATEAMRAIEAALEPEGILDPGTVPAEQGALPPTSGQRVAKGAQSEMARTMTVQGRLVLEDRVTPGRIILSDGVISSVELDDGDNGPLICPGFVDVHVHGHGGHDAMGGTAALDGMARALLRRGVTSFLPTAVTAPLTTLRQFAEDVRSWRAHASNDGAQALGFNLEGPFIDPVRKGAQNPEYIISPADVSTAELEPLLEQWRMVTMAPELPGAIELIRWLTARGVVISLGHSSATAEQAAEAYAAGATSTTHLFNAMSGVHHHSPGLAAAALALDEACVEFIADGQHVDRMLWPIVLRTKPADRFVLVTDAISLAATGQSHGTLGGLEVEVHGDRCTLVEGGALAGSVISLDTAVRNLVRSGVPLPRAVAAATVHPLSLIDVTDRGRLAPGQRADLLELDDDLGVQRVMLEGEWVETAA